MGGSWVVELLGGSWVVELLGGSHTDAFFEDMGKSFVCVCGQTFNTSPQSGDFSAKNGPGPDIQYFPTKW
jgi:hypothetical protein